MKKTDVVEREKSIKTESMENKEKISSKKPFKKRFWVEVKNFDQGEDKDILMPEYKTVGSCGCDLKLANESVTIEPGFRYCVNTGIGIKMTRGYVGFVTPRSGLAHEHGLSIVNSPGEIDNDYRGEIKVNLINLGDKPIQLKRGDRIAQLTFVECKYGNHFLRKVDEFSPEKVNERGNKGFGSTGIESEIVSEDKEESSENNEN